METTPGDYPRSRRPAVPPESTNLPRLGSRRRISGLRREDLTLLASVTSLALLGLLAAARESGVDCA